MSKQLKLTVTSGSKSCSVRLDDGENWFELTHSKGTGVTFPTPVIEGVSAVRLEPAGKDVVVTLDLE